MDKDKKKKNYYYTNIGARDVNQTDLVLAAAAFLKKSGKLKVPEWVDIVKTGTHKELAPIDKDWFYTRCASIARRIYMRHPVGIGALTKVYGGKKRRGVRPSKYVLGSSSVARKALQALEAIKWVEKCVEGGRRLTSEGYRDLDRIARQAKKKRNRVTRMEVLALSQK